MLKAEESVRGSLEDTVSNQFTRCLFGAAYTVRGQFRAKFVSHAAREFTSNALLSRNHLCPAHLLVPPPINEICFSSQRAAFRNLTGENQVKHFGGRQHTSELWLLHQRGH